MPKLCITECSMLGEDLRGRSAPVVKMPPNRDYSIDITTESTPSDLFGKKTTILILKAQGDCSLAWGLSEGEVPTAVAGVHNLDAGETRYYSVTPGFCLAVIESD